MTPLEHYREAENDLRRIGDSLLAAEAAGEDVLELSQALLPAIAAAQVHATLANAHMTAGVWGDPDTAAKQAQVMP